MIKNLFFTLVFLHCISLLPAQSSGAVPVIRAINKNIATIKQGYFESIYRWKSATKSDTSIGAARVYFFKDENESDSICRFVTFRSGALSEAYDGTSLYSVNNEKRTVSYRPVSDRGGIAEMLGGNIRHMVAFQPYLLKKQAFNPGKFHNALIDTFDVPSGKALRVTVLDSFKNQLKITASDLNMGQIRGIYEISLLDTTLFRKREIITFMTSPQYLENNLSPIVALSDSITFEKIFNLSQLLASGYELIDNSKKSKPPQPLVSVGDTMTSFRLKNLDGHEISSDTFIDGLILLDFWYKGCAPCLMAMPSMERLHKKYKDRGLQVLGVNSYDRDPVNLKSFIREREVTYTTLLDAGKVLAGEFRVAAYPTMILIEAKSRQVLLIQEGFSTELESKIEALMEDRLKKGH